MFKPRPPRIAVISDRHFPSETTDTQQIIKNTAALNKAGLRADLIIPFKIKNLFRGRARVAADLKSFYNLQDTIPLRQIKLFPAMKPNLEKIFHGLLAPFFALFCRYPLVYTRNPLAALLSLLLRRKVIFEAYRMLGDEHPRLMRFFSGFARGPRFLGIIVHSNLAGDSLVRAGFPAGKVRTFYNGYDAADVATGTTKAGARGRIGVKPGRKLVVYTGNMQRNKGIDSVIDIASHLPGVDFLLVGGVPKHIEPLKEYAAAKNIRNIQFTGHKQISELPFYLQAADVLIIPPTAIPLMQFGRTVLPIKTFLYLAAGKPVLAGRLPDVAEVLKHGENALLVKPDDPRGAAKAIRDLLADPKKSSALGKGALRTAAGLTWEARGERIRDWILSTLGN